MLAHVPFWAGVVAALEHVPAGTQALQRIMEHLGQAAGDRSIDLEVLSTTIVEHATDAKEVTMNSLEKLLEKGRKQGVVLGPVEGHTNAQRKTLLKLLRLRFVDLSDDDVAKVEQADDAALEEYLERILTADSVTAALGGCDGVGIGLGRELDTHRLSLRKPAGCGLRRASP